MLHPERRLMHLLHIDLEGGGDVRRMHLVPAAVEAFRVGVGSTGDCGLPRDDYREQNKRCRVKKVSWHNRVHYIIRNYTEWEKEAFRQTETH